MKRTALACLLMGLAVGAPLAFANGDDGLPTPPRQILQQDQEQESAQNQEQEGATKLQPIAGPSHTRTSKLPPIEGLWRLEGVHRDPVEAVGGRVRVFLEGDQMRYERRSRLGTSGESRLERGQVVRRGPTVFFRADQGTGAGAGFSNVLTGEQVQETEARGPTVVAYRPKSQAGETWRGVRRDDGRTTGQERLSRWSQNDGNHVELLIDGEAFDGMEAAIRSAKRTIDVQTFQWADDETGRRIANLLIAKVKEGVRVRCLVDSSSKTVNWMVSFHTKEPKVDITGQTYHGYKPFPRSFFKKGLDDDLLAGGVELIHAHGYLKGMGTSVVDSFRGIGNWIGGLFGKKTKPREKRGISNHDHRKILIVDESVGFCGGMNLAREYQYEWHDVVARVEGPAAFDLHESFVDRWQAAGGEGEVEREPTELWESEDWNGDVPVQVVGSLPGLNTTLRDRYLEEIEKSQKRILIEMAYFLDDAIIDALGKAAQRGVRTVVIIPDDKVNDVYLVKEAFAWIHNDVLRAGIELYKYQPRLNHCKVAAFDGRLATVGSCNLDAMALDMLAEINLWIPDVRFTRALETRIFVEDLPKSKRAKPIKLGWGRKIRAKTLHLMRGAL